MKGNRLQNINKAVLKVFLTIICLYFFVFSSPHFTPLGNLLYQNEVTAHTLDFRTLKIFLWEIFLILTTAFAIGASFMGQLRKATREEVEKDAEIERLTSSLEIERSKNKDRELEINYGAEGAEKFNQLIDGLWDRVQGELSAIATAGDISTTNVKSKKEVFNIIENTGIMKLRLGILSPSTTESTNIKQVVDNVLLMLYPLTLKQNIQISIEEESPVFYFETDKVLIEYMILCIFLRIIAGFGEKKKIKIEYVQDISGFCDICIEDDGFEIDFFSFKTETMFNSNLSSIKLLARQLGCTIIYERFSEHNLTKIRVPDTIRAGGGYITSKKVVDLETYRKNNV